MLDIMSIFVAAIVMVSSGQDFTNNMEPKVPTPVVETVSPTELNCLAKTIYYEAGGEPQEGKYAVGFTTINRTKFDGYPDTVCKVVKQKTMDTVGTRHCQFNWYCNNGEHRLSSTPSNDAYAESLTVAKRILSKRVDNWIPNAVSFHSTSVDPKWKRRGALVQLAKYGNHVFYGKKEGS